jgi:high-affinity K+ transport system ATPase subunit B
MSIKISKIAQLFLYLTVVFASVTVAIGETRSPSTESAFEQSVSCAKQGLSDNDTGFDKLDDCILAYASLVIRRPQHTVLSGFIYQPRRTTVLGNFSIRAPPFLFS